MARTEQVLTVDEAFVRSLEAVLRHRALFAPPPLFGARRGPYVTADFEELCECISEASTNAVAVRKHIARVLA